MGSSSEEEKHILKLIKIKTDMIDKIRKIVNTYDFPIFAESTFIEYFVNIKGLFPIIYKLKPLKKRGSNFSSFSYFELLSL